ncbi:hypothetical protein MC862_003515 [Proteus mirabilis]|nr:hypothetical protein [Proteus mirabilis]HEK0447669.1 hypothetical protein [Proteus mirabilis]
MNIIINDDGSARIETKTYSATYCANGYLKLSIGGKAPEKITINHPKKEIGKLIYKVSVDTSDLDKLEEQLTRIKQLMQDVGMNPKSILQFSYPHAGKFFIKDALINSAVFNGVLVSNKSEQSVNAQLADLRMRADRQDNDIAELIRLRHADQQAWSEAINRTWCSQK